MYSQIMFEYQISFILSCWYYLIFSAVPSHAVKYGKTDIHFQIDNPFPAGTFCMVLQLTRHIVLIQNLYGKDNFLLFIRPTIYLNFPLTHKHIVVSLLKFLMHETIVMFLSTFNIIRKRFITVITVIFLSHFLNQTVVSFEMTR